jgi:hypothetical protein
MCKKIEGRGLLQTEATLKEEIRNTAEYLNEKYREDRFVNIIYYKPRK